MKQKSYKINIEINKEPLIQIIKKLASVEDLPYVKVLKTLQKNPSPEGFLFAKTQVLTSYDVLKSTGIINLSSAEERNFKRNIRMKKVRTMSGVTPVTVLTKPFPCPGKCIFCPNDVRMPKSYMADEPGAQRAAMNKFDPYFQVFNRLVAYRNMGHPTEKIELIVLGGTWSHYPEFYRIWFIKRCFDAMNEFGESTTTETLEVTTEDPIDNDLLQEIKGESSKTTYNKVVAKALISKLSEQKNETATWQELEAVQKINETTKSRCVGLVLETRPDEITKEELISIRRMGGTKVQIGIQSLDDEVLRLNKRGHDVARTRDAITMIRQAGFKIHAHWMPNLYGSTPEKDILDYRRLFEDPAIRPDELKVYPCSLIESAELMQYHKNGKWQPYSDEQLEKVLVEVFSTTPRYCRLTRVIRDIPSTDIVVGNKKTNLRQIVERKMALDDVVSKDIRAREIRGESVSGDDLSLKVTEFQTPSSKELFIEYITSEDKIAGFLRLSLPTTPNIFEELVDTAMIREVHVYGQSIELGDAKKGKAQHVGLGKKLVARAEEFAKKESFNKISVISAIGTREYYKKLGYSMQGTDLYMHKKI